MRELIQFIVRYNSIFIFIILELVCFIFLSAGNSYQRASLLNSANQIAGNTFQMRSNVSDYLNLRTVNDSLVRENAKLHQQIQQMQQADRSVVVRDTIETPVVINEDSLIYDCFLYTEAKIINNSTNRLNNFITLDKGYKDGLEKEMGLVGANGVVGIIKDVSANYSSAMSLLHKNIRISAKIKANNYFGIIVWQGRNPDIVSFRDIPNHVEVNKGDTIVTSGFSAIFPEDILIGVVEEISLKDGANFYTIDVRLASDFRRLKYVYAIENLNKDEQLILQEESEDE